MKMPLNSSSPSSSMLKVLAGGHHPNSPVLACAPLPPAQPNVASLPPAKPQSCRLIKATAAVHPLPSRDLPIRVSLRRPTAAAAFTVTPMQDDGDDRRAGLYSWATRWWGASDGLSRRDVPVRVSLRQHDMTMVQAGEVMPLELKEKERTRGISVHSCSKRVF